MKIMAVDFGYSRTGIAVCDKMEILASPVTVIHEKDMGRCAVRVAEEAAKLAPELVVVGLPRRTDGKEGETEKRASEFAEKLRSLISAEIVLWDERLTTVMAHQILDTADVHGKKRKNSVDAVAATLILESYLNYRRNTNAGK
ncbi:MAG: Holliday junction resolvase RuvX [Oscillospiraceae bacterium]|nr:Holliday junction resolvase RuvX [Oscillospiraceae bacterium]